METANLATNAHLLMVMLTFNKIVKTWIKIKWEVKVVISRIRFRIFLSNLVKWWILMPVLINNRYLVNKTCHQLWPSYIGQYSKVCMIILYVGDHVYADVLRSKRTLGWRTCLIIPELTNEIETHKKQRISRTRLINLRREQFVWLQSDKVLSCDFVVSFL